MRCSLAIALKLLDSAARRLTIAGPVSPWMLLVDAAKLDTYRDFVSVRLRRTFGAITERAVALADLGDYHNACILALAAFDTGSDPHGDWAELRTVPGAETSVGT